MGKENIYLSKQFHQDRKTYLHLQMPGYMDCEEGKHDIPKKTYETPYRYLFLKANNSKYSFLVLFVYFSETGPHCAALAGLEFITYTRLTSNL